MSCVRGEILKCLDTIAPNSLDHLQLRQKMPSIQEFAQICLFKTRERKTFCRMYVLISITQKIPETKWISTRIGNRAENPPNIAGSLQVDGAIPKRAKNCRNQRLEREHALTNWQIFFSCKFLPIFGHQKKYSAKMLDPDPRYCWEQHWVIKHVESQSQRFSKIQRATTAGWRSTSIHTCVIYLIRYSTITLM